MDETLQVTVGALRWQIAPGYQDCLLGPDGLRLNEWLAGGMAHIVKHGPHRTVYRVRLDGLDFHLKHFRITDARTWLRELVRPAKARMEHERALAVAARGVPTVVPLALGERLASVGPGDSYLITRSLVGAVPINAFIEQTLPTFAPGRQVRVRQRLATELGVFVARMHDAGILHHDLHPGNVLVRLDPEDQVALFLIDLHAVSLRRSLEWRISRDNLTMFNRWFTLRVGRADRLRFWRAYAAQRSSEGLGNPSHFDLRTGLPRSLERKTWASNLHFWRGRDQRCLVVNRYYRRVRSALARGYAVADLDRAALAELLANPDGPFERPDAILLKNSRSSTVAEFQLTVDGIPRPVIYKRFRVTAWTDPLAALVRRSPALRSWVFGHGLRERCLPTPRPLAVLHRCRRGLAYEGYLLTEKLPEAVDLQRVIADLGARSPADRRSSLHRQIEQIARLVRELHRRRLAHRDLKAANILIQSPKYQVQSPKSGMDFGLCWLIDLVGVTRYRKLSRSRRVQNLARLHASFSRSPVLTRTDKLRFLRVYLQWGLFGRENWKCWWHQVEAATQLKIARNARSGRVLA